MRELDGREVVGRCLVGSGREWRKWTITRLPVGERNTEKKRQIIHGVPFILYFLNTDHNQQES